MRQITIPLGKEPTDKQKASFEKLGFDLNTIEKRNDFSIALPDVPHLRLKEKSPAFDRRELYVYCNDVEVISIHQKTAIYDSFVMFNIVSVEEIEEALSKPAEKPVELTEFQKRLDGRLKNLEYIIFGSGAQRGFGKTIGAQFSYLQELREENPEEHDKLIKSNENYTELFEMFPNWTDPKNLQRRYESYDVGFFAATVGSGIGQRDGEADERPECSIM